MLEAGRATLEEIGPSSIPQLCPPGLGYFARADSGFAFWIHLWIDWVGDLVVVKPATCCALESVCMPGGIGVNLQSECESTFGPQLSQFL